MVGLRQRIRNRRIRRFLDRAEQNEEAHVRRLAKECDVPFEYAEAIWDDVMRDASRRVLLDHRFEMLSSLNQLAFSDDPDVAAEAPELARRLAAFYDEVDGESS